MPMRARLASLWRTLRRPGALDSDLDQELRTYVDELIARYERAGMTPADARRAAVLEAGTLESLKDQVRDARVGNALETTMQDVKLAWRSLRRSPGFLIVAIVTLALGIGANTAIFSVVRAMLLAPLPYRDSDRLVFVWADMTKADYPRGPLSGPELKDLRDRATRFDGFGAIWATSAALTGDGDPEQLRIALVSTNFFSLLGADAALGRTFLPEDESSGPPKAILISAALWQRRYGSDPNIVGRTIRANGQPVTVVGVMPAGYRLLMPPDAAVPDDLEAWLLLNPAALTRGPRGQMYLRVVGRMKPGVTLEQARGEIDGIARQISREFTDYSANGRAFTTVGLQADGVRQLRPILLALFAGVGLLLLIACVNVAGLLIARAAARGHETAVRSSLGAGRLRLFRQHLVEGLMLSVLGAAAGLLVARAGLSALLALRPATLDRLAAAHLDVSVLAFTAGIAIAWGLLLSLAPVFEVFRDDLTGALRHEGRQLSGTVHYRTRAAIVVLQIAVTVVLAVGAVLLVRTFAAIQRIDPGFHSDSTLTFRLSLPGQRYPNAPAFNAFGRKLEKDLAGIPGVAGIGSVSHLPYENFPNWGGPYISTPGADEATALFADHRAVTPGFFPAVGARLVEGRYFAEDDDERREPVAIVDDQLARRTWPGDTAIGKRIAADPRSTGHPVFWATVVGVVGHVRHRSLIESLNDQVYFAERQIQRNPMAYVVRVNGDPASVAPAVRRAVAAIDPLLPVWDVRPLDEYVTAARAAQRFTMLLATVFAVVALLLAGVGVYGVIAYAMTRRRHEFGVRLALGARPGQVTALLLGEGAWLAAIGVSFGVVFAALAARALRSQLYGVTPGDVPSFAIAVVAITAAALVACWIPAWRASAISPSEALRAEGGL